MKIIDRFANINFNPFNMLTWLQNEDKNSLWINYLYNHSGNKEESCLLSNYVFVNDNSLDILNNIIKNIYLDKWNKLYNVLNSEYNPIENYNRVENTTINNTGNETTNENINNSEVLTGGHTNNNTNENTHKISAFNDVNFSNDSNDVNNSTDVFTYNDETKTNTGTNISSKNNTGTNETHSTISGNIGVTTTQQMIVREIELRKYNLVNEFYSDLDNLLTIGIYFICKAVCVYVYNSY